MTGERGLGRRIAPPRFLLFLVLLPIGFAAHRWLFHPNGWADSAAMAFDAAAIVFLASLIPLVRQAGGAAIRSHADANDANRVLILVITTLLTVVVLVAIAGELDDARGGSLVSAAKLVVTLLLVWLFANSVYALHYAHEWYLRDPGEGDSKGIDFPGEAEPGYLDFAYFAFTLGMTFQTSDCDVTSRRMRAVVILHSFAAFLFNIGVIAFTINVLGGTDG